MSFEDEMRSAMATFVVEARELLQDMETGLLGLENDADPAESVNAIFRAAHTIKGSSGLFGLDHLVRFTHVLESVLDRLRNDEIAVSPELVGVLLPCTDHLGRLMDGVVEGRLDEDPALAAEGAALHARLEPWLSGDGSAAGTPAAPAVGAVADAALVPAGAGETAAAGGAIHLSLRFGPDCLRNGMDPLSFIRYLSTLGAVRSVAVLDGLMPETAGFDPETSYLDFEVTLDTTADVASVADVFEFVAEDSDITVLAAGSPAADYAALVTGSGELAGEVAEVLVRTGAVPASALAAALASAGSDVEVPAGAQVAAATPAPAPATAPAPSAEPAPQAAPSVPAQTRTEDVSRAKAAPAAAAPSAAAAGREARSIRVDAGRLDRLIDVVGELVIAGAGAGLHATTNGDETLLASIGELMRLVEEVRDSALQLRMVPIGTTFSRFQRVVRDVSADLGKDIALVISGGETEVDKALVEQIGDPLMHLVRNSMDHGIELADVRAGRGKPARGTLRLNAFHDSGSIVIEVSDDGGGIDPEKILAKAVERGIVEPGASLSEQDILQLIFEPGFSTAAQVSDLSGRGVGMDVVKRNVTTLRGTIDVESRVGEGTTMRIRLPLTLAIIDGFLVGVGGASYVVPLDRVIECVELPANNDVRDCMDLRGEVLPFIRLRSLFGIGGERPRRENVVVVEYAGMKVGLVVDALMGEFQTVIKPLGTLFGHVDGIGGATILGNGDVALIIDVSMLVRSYGERQSEQEHVLVAR